MAARERDGLTGGGVGGATHLGVGEMEDGALVRWAARARGTAYHVRGEDGGGAGAMGGRTSDVAHERGAR